MELLVAIGVGAAALAASIMGGMTGMGTAIVMIPVLTFVVGIREAIPIVTVAVTMQMFSRVWVNRHYIDYRVARWFAIGAVPASVAGAVIFANTGADLLARALGIFLLVAVVYRHLPVSQRRIPTRGFVGVGVGQGFLSALFGGAGPFGATFFLSYGLVRNAFIGTVALAMMAINFVKIAVYGSYSLLDARALSIAVGVGLIMVVGAYAGGVLVRRISDRAFVYAVEAVMVTAGVLLIVSS